MENLEQKIIGITFGIRFNRSFRVPEISGEIIDDILYSNKTPFGTKFFPRIQETRREKVLVNDETTEYLRINTDDLILGLEVKDDFEEKFNRADVIFWERLLEAGSWQQARLLGWLRSEGKEYAVKDGDVIEFKI